MSLVAFLPPPCSPLASVSTPPPPNHGSARLLRNRGSGQQLPKHHEVLHHLPSPEPTRHMPRSFADQGPNHQQGLKESPFGPSPSRFLGSTLAVEYKKQTFSEKKHRVCQGMQVVGAPWRFAHFPRLGPAGEQFRAGFRGAVAACRKSFASGNRFLSSD